MSGDLRHAYRALKTGQVVNQPMLADGLIAPQIKALEDLVASLEQERHFNEPMTCPKCGIERHMFPACAQDGCPGLIRGDDGVVREAWR